MLNWLKEHAFVATLALIGCVIPVIALAQQTTGAPAQAGIDWTTIIVSLIGAVAVPLLGLLSKLAYSMIPLIVAQAKEKTKIAQSETIDRAKNRALDLMQVFVLEGLQTSVDALKQEFAAGKIDKEALQRGLLQAKDATLTKWKKHATAAGIIDDIKFIAGDDLDGFAGSMLEAVVATVKNTRKVPPPVTSNSAPVLPGQVEPAAKDAEPVPF